MTILSFKLALKSIVCATLTYWDNSLNQPLPTSRWPCIHQSIKLSTHLWADPSWDIVHSSDPCCLWAYSWLTPAYIAIY